MHVSLNRDYFVQKGQCNDCWWFGFCGHKVISIPDIDDIDCETGDILSSLEVNIYKLQRINVEKWYKMCMLMYITSKKDKIK